MGNMESPPDGEVTLQTLYMTAAAGGKAAYFLLVKTGPGAGTSAIVAANIAARQDLGVRWAAEVLGSDFPVIAAAAFANDNPLALLSHRDALEAGIQSTPGVVSFTTVQVAGSEYYGPLYTHASTPPGSNVERRVVNGWP